MIYLVIISEDKIIEIVNTSGFENRQLFNVMTDNPVDILTSIRYLVTKLSSKRIPFQIYSIETDINIIDETPDNLYDAIIQNGSKIFAR